MLRYLVVAMAAALAACATTPSYAPAATARASGYSETQIESNRYFVSFRSASAVDAALLEDFAMLRAADLTLQAGRDWFWVDRRSVDEERGSYGGPSIGVGVGAGNWGRHTGVNVGVGVNIPLGQQSGPRARLASLEVRFGEGMRPDAANAYDAHALAANLRARLLAPR